MNVVTHQRFQPRDAQQADPLSISMEGIRKVGLTDAVETALADLKLPEPAFDEVVIGELTEDEARLFVEFNAAHKAYKAAEREVSGEFLMRVGAMVKEGEDPDPEEQANMVPEEDALKYFRLQRRASALQSLLFWQVCERLGGHDYFVAVRHKGKVVKQKRKW